MKITRKETAWWNSLTDEQQYMLMHDFDKYEPRKRLSKKTKGRLAKMLRRKAKKRKGSRR